MIVPTKYIEVLGTDVTKSACRPCWYLLAGFAVLLIKLLIPEITLAETRSTTGQIEHPIGSGQSVGPGGCLTEAEAELGRLVNTLREEHQLPSIPIVEPLYKVAKWHVIDLAINTPHRDRNDDRGMACNLHSWSDKGKEYGGGWTSLCYTSDHKQALGMWNKPREISEYRSNGYEVVYWTSAPFSPAMAINYWSGRDEELDMILERKAWKRHAWRSIGVGVYGNYAAVWLSERSSQDFVLNRCEQSRD